jgi:hypothetical protein
MIETEPNECWSVYTIDDSVCIYTKYSGHGQFNEYKDESVKWTFTFHPRHLNDIRRLSQQNDLRLALVCANHALPERIPLLLGEEGWLALEKKLRRKYTGICFLGPDEWRACLDLEDERTQSITAELARGNSFLLNGRLRVAQNALDAWQVRQNSITL